MIDEGHHHSYGALLGLGSHFLYLSLKNFFDHTTKSLVFLCELGPVRSSRYEHSPVIERKTPDISILHILINEVDQEDFTSLARGILHHGLENRD